MITRRDWLTGFEFIDKLNSMRGNRSLRDFAKELGVSNTFLGDVLALQKSPGDKIPEAVGYEAITLYRPIEIDIEEKERSK
jgi:hypothetical protein